MRDDSMQLMFEGESSDVSDDSNDAEDGTDLDCNIHKLDAVQNQECLAEFNSIRCLDIFLTL